MADDVPKNFALLATFAISPQQVVHDAPVTIPLQRVVLPDIWPVQQWASDRRALQLLREQSDELSAAYQRIIELKGCMSAVASVLGFLQHEISVSDSHNSRQQIASALADLQQRIIAPQ
jgi:hypothetical protein